MPNETKNVCFSTYSLQKCLENLFAGQKSDFCLYIIETQNLAEEWLPSMNVSRYREKSKALVKSVKRCILKWVDLPVETSPSGTQALKTT